MPAGLLGLGGARAKQQPGGKWYQEYQTTTDPKRAQQLYDTYGKRHGWEKKGAAPTGPVNNQPIPGAAPSADPPGGPSYPQYPGAAAAQTITPIAGIDSNMGRAVTEANQQTPFNMQNIGIQQQTNRPNVNTPFGSMIWQTDQFGNTFANMGLSGQEQEKYGKENWLDSSRLSGAGDIWSSQLQPLTQQKFDYGSAAAMPTLGQQNLDLNRASVEGRVYENRKRQLDPEWKQREGDLQQMLADRGLTPGSEGWQRQMNQFEKNRQEAYQGASDTAFEAAGSEQGRLADLSLGLRNQGISEAEALRNRPFEEYAALRGQGSSVRDPGFSQIMASMPQLSVPQPQDVMGQSFGYAGLENQKDIAKLNAQTQLKVAGMQAAGGGGEEEDVGYGQTQYDFGGGTPERQVKMGGFAPSQQQNSQMQYFGNTGPNPTNWQGTPQTQQSRFAPGQQSTPGGQYQSRVQPGGGYQTNRKGLWGLGGRRA